MPPFAPYEAPAPETRAGSRLTMRVLGLALLGYAYVLGVLAGLLLVAVAAVFLAPSIAALVWITIPLCALALVVFRALWVRLPAPDGIRLARRDAPELFALLQELRRDLRAPRLHEVWVDGTFNASVGQAPRLGIVGPYRNVLVVGLSLLQALTPEELRAVLAHELGHVSRRHGRASAWVYRLRETWERVLAHLEAAGHWAVVLFRPFFRWYVPRFEQASLALARAHEYEADQAAARAAGVEATASLLVRLEVGNAFLGECFWPELWERADRDPTPPRALALVGRPLRAAGEHEDARRWIADALAVVPELETTHPSLRARLAALGLDPEHVRPWPASVSVSAADAILGPELAHSLVEVLDERWREEASAAWRAQHEEAREAQSRLAELEVRGSWRDLPPDELREYAGLASRLRGLGEARAAWERVLELEPDAGEALLALGELHAERGDPRAHDLLERAAEAEPVLAPTALATLAVALAKEGRDDEAAGCRRRAVEAQLQLEQAHAERTHLTPANELAPHGLSDDEVGRIAAALDRKDIARGYLARKATDTLGDSYPVYIVGYVRRGRAWRYERRGAGERLQGELLEALGDLVPGPFWLVDVTEDAGRLHRRLRKVEGSRLVGRGRSSRPIARGAPVLVGLLILGGLVTRVAGEDPAAPPGPSAAELVENMANARYRWAARAEEVCAVFRTHADLRLDDVRRERGELGFAETWAVVRPFEQQIVDGLHAPPRIDEGDIAVDLLARDLQRLDRIADEYTAGRRKAAQAGLARFERDDSTQQALAVLGVHGCTPSAPLAR